MDRRRDREQNGRKPPEVICAVCGQAAPHRGSLRVWVGGAYRFVCAECSPAFVAALRRKTAGIMNRAKAATLAELTAAGTNRPSQGGPSYDPR